MYYLLGHRLVAQKLPDARRKQIIADNTFLLTLDGDVDFQPSAVQLLVDRMKKNDKVGAACGRIHPVGTGESSRVAGLHCLVRRIRFWLDEGRAS